VRTAGQIAEFLKDHPKVEKIYWPGFPDSSKPRGCQKANARFWRHDISIVLKGADLQETFRIASSFKVFSLAESLGGVESLINHPVSMTHGSIPKAEREKAGVVDNLLRLSVGVEDIEDLLEDLKQALA
jgi:cystathionine gamma-lyase